MSPRFLFLIAVALLSSCTTSSKYRQIPLRYEPTPKVVAGLAAKTFSIAVTDARPYVTHGNKVPAYVGIARGGWGNPIDMVNGGKLSLAEQMRGDLLKKFRALGLTETSGSASKQVSVRIRDWNFDAGIDARFWYEVELTVADSAGKLLAISQAKDQKVIKANLLTGPVVALQKEVPVYYGEIIQELVRKDPLILSALRIEP